jgi:hypothetical protein
MPNIDHVPKVHYGIWDFTQSRYRTICRHELYANENLRIQRESWRHVTCKKCLKTLGKEEYKLYTLLYE